MEGFIYTLQKRKRKTISKKETQNHIQKKKRKTTYWWHWEDNFNCCMVGPRISKFRSCKNEDPGDLPYSNWNYLPNVTNMWFCVSFFECGFAFLFFKWFCVSFFEEYTLTFVYFSVPSSAQFRLISVEHVTFRYSCHALICLARALVLL